MTIAQRDREGGGLVRDELYITQSSYHDTVLKRWVYTALSCFWGSGGQSEGQCGQLKAITQVILLQNKLILF